MPCSLGFYSFVFQFFGLFAFVLLGFVAINIYYQSYKPKLFLWFGLVFLVVFLFCAGNMYYNGNKLLAKIDPSCQKTLIAENAS